MQYQVFMQESGKLTTVFPARWEVVEAGAGAPILFGASLPPNMTGPQVAGTRLHLMQMSTVNVSERLVLPTAIWEMQAVS